MVYERDKQKQTKWWKGEEGKRRKKMLGKVSGMDKISNVEKRIKFCFLRFVIYRLDIVLLSYRYHMYTIWIIHATFERHKVPLSFVSWPALTSFMIFLLHPHKMAHVWAVYKRVSRAIDKIIDNGMPHILPAFLSFLWNPDLAENSSRKTKKDWENSFSLSLSLSLSLFHRKRLP